MTMSIFIHWLIVALAIIITAYLLPGVTISGFLTALITAIILGLINAFLKPLLLLVTLPLNVLTLGLFTFVINALLIMLTSALVPGFGVANFWWALLFSLVLSIVTALLEYVVTE